MEEKKPFSQLVKENLWLLGAIAGLLIIIGWGMPMFSTKPITATLSGEWYELSKGSRGNVGIDGLLSGGSFLWIFCVIYSLVGIGIVLSLLGKICKKCYEVAIIVFLVTGILLLTGNVLYDYTKCASVIGSSFMDYLEDWRSLAGTRSSAGIIWGTTFSFVACLINLSAAYEVRKFTLRDLVEIAMLSALAIVIDVIQHLLPSIGVTGGSIGIATLPLLYIALRHGPLAGFISGGIVYGLITCITDGYGIFLYPFDYLLGFGSVAILGFFKPLIFGKGQEKYNVKGEIFIFVGVILSALVRFIGSSLSSIVNYGYTLVAAMAYNVLYVFISALVCGVILMALYGPLLRLQKSFPPSSAK